MEYLKELSQAQKVLLSEVCKVAKLLLVMLASNALSERSFSALRRVKSFLCSYLCRDGCVKCIRYSHLRCGSSLCILSASN